MKEKKIYKKKRSRKSKKKIKTIRVEALVDCE
jgi:hypothetical protein